LRSLSFSGEDLEEALALLISEDFLNEERFARSYCRGKFNQNNWGRLKIMRYLKQKDVSDYCIRKGMEEIEEEAYEATLNRLFKKKWDTLSSEKNLWVKKKKTKDYLLSKGFEPGLIDARMEKG